jgi:acetoacetate decarboxylase
MMPAHFGAVMEEPAPATYHDVTQIMLTYETEQNVLERYVPDAFQCTEPLIMIGYSMCRGVDWLAGGGYNLVNVAVPVAYTNDRERIEGAYVFVIWENKTIPILTGREQTGMPKIFADIEDHHQIGDRVLTNASYEGWTFLRIDFQQKKQMSPEELNLLNQRMGSVNAFGWRHITNIGRSGAALSHATLFPQELVQTAAWMGEGQVQWTALGPEQYPLHHVVTQALSQLPIISYRECLMSRGSLILRNDLARQLP